MFGFWRAREATRSSDAAGAMGRLKGAASSLLALAGNRLSLLALEIEAEKLRLLSLFLMGAFALFFLGLGLLFAVVTVAFVFWETHREWVLGCFSLFFLIVGMLFLIVTLRQKKQPSPLFASSLAELEKDRAQLDADGPPVL